MNVAQRFGARKFAKTNLKTKRKKFTWAKTTRKRDSEAQHELDVTSKFKSKIRAISNQNSTSAVALYRTAKQIRAVMKQIKVLELEAYNIQRQITEKNMILDPQDRRLWDQKRLLARQSRELDELRSANSDTYYFGDQTQEDKTKSKEDESDDNESDFNSKSDSEKLEFSHEDSVGCVLMRMVQKNGEILIDEFSFTLHKTTS